MELRINGIRVLRSEVNEYSKIEVNQDQEADIGIGVESKLKAEKIEDTKFRVFVHILYYLELESEEPSEETTELGHFDIELDFFVKKPGEELTTQELKKVLYTLYSMSYSTIRGVIYERTLGFTLNQFILPPLMAANINKAVDLDIASNFGQVSPEDDKIL